MTLVWGIRRVDDNRPDRAQAGVCNYNVAHLAPCVWSLGDGKVSRAICEQHLRMVMAGATAMSLYGQITQCPKWSKRPNPKHEHGKDCLL